MLKNFIYFIIITFSLLSCKKENYHKIKYEVVFIQDCDNCYADFITVTCKPQDPEKKLGITASKVTTGYVWSYEYGGLKDGDKVVFSVGPTGLEYRFKISVYIDDKLISYRECYGPNGVLVLDEWGLNNSKADMAVIEFIYNE
jgi:hypothetical protein